MALPVELSRPRVQLTRMQAKSQAPGIHVHVLANMSGLDPRIYTTHTYLTLTSSPSQWLSSYGLSLAIIPDFATLEAPGSYISDPHQPGHPGG